MEFNKEIINIIKNGSCVFIFSEQKEYLKHSIYLDLNKAILEFNKNRQNNKFFNRNYIRKFIINFFCHKIV